MKDKVIESLLSYGSDLDMGKISEVYDYVKVKFDHLDEPMESPGEMTSLVASFQPDLVTIYAVFLRYLYNQGVLDEEEIRNKFGEEVLKILREVKNIEALNYAANDKKTRIEALRMMFLSMITDLRVVFVVLSCRIYTMKHLERDMGSKNGTLFARETLDLYVPVAARLGIYSFKSALEDLAFSYLNVVDYKDLEDQLERLRKKFNISIIYIQEKLEKFFVDRGIEVKIQGRIKNIYSVYKKLQKKGLSSATDLYDIFAMRIILPVGDDENDDRLYGILGMLHSEWKPISRRFKDYIAVPKPNGYRSLHTCVLGLGPANMDQPVEIQIRDSVMNDDAQYGVASHWRYKHRGKTDSLDRNIDWIKGLEQFSVGLEDGNDFDRDGLDSLSDRIFVLTPRGEVKDLPVGATPIDFAYVVHTDVGNRCVMAKVNSSIAPLSQELISGDVVEIVTKKSATPRLQWLALVKTSLARNKIRFWFGSLNKDKNIKEGRDLINAQLERIGKPLLDNKYSILKNYLGRNLNLSARDLLVEEVGKGSKIAADIIKKVFPYETTVVDKIVRDKVKAKKDVDKKAEKGSLESSILVGDEDGLPVKIAACCKPKRGDNILGYVTRGNHVTIHKVTCLHIDKLDTERIVFADWKGERAHSKGDRYLVGIKVEAVTRVGLMSDVVNVIAGMGIHVRDVQIKDRDKNRSYEYFLVELDDLDMFDRLVDKIEAVRGVLKVSREIKKKC